MKYSLKLVFENIFWPAVAGNVFWALCNLIINSSIDEIPFSRIVILLFFLFYLTISWLRTRVAPYELPRRRWLFEFFHLVTIIFAALSAHLEPRWLESALYAYFIVTAAGHFAGAWKEPGIQESNPFQLGILNLAGLIVLIAGDYAGLSDGYRLPGSFVLVFFLWLLFGRWKEIIKIENRLRKHAPNSKYE